MMPRVLQMMLPRKGGRTDSGMQGNGHWNAAKATKNAKNNAWGAHLRMLDLNAGSCTQKMQKKPPAGWKMAFLPALMNMHVDRGGDPPVDSDSSHHEAARRSCGPMSLLHLDACSASKNGKEGTDGL